MKKEMNDPKYVYADILIALAQIDDHVDDREKEVLDSIFSKMELDPEITKQMWMTPRTMDVVESILKDIEDSYYKRCLLKDCYLVAYADEKLVPEESKFIQNIRSTLNLGYEVEEDIHQWVKTAISLNQKEQDLFCPPSYETQTEKNNKNIEMQFLLEGGAPL